MPAVDASVAIDDEGGWKPVNRAEPIEFCKSPHHHWVVDLILPHKLCHLRLGSFVHRNPDYFKAALLVLPLQLHKHWNLKLAGPTPGGPEIHQHHLASVVGKFDWFAGEVTQFKIDGGSSRGLRSSLVRFALIGNFGQGVLRCWAWSIRLAVAPLTTAGNKR